MAPLHDGRFPRAGPWVLAPGLGLALVLSACAAGDVSTEEPDPGRSGQG